MSKTKQAWDKLMYMLGFDGSEKEEDFHHDEFEELESDRKKANLVGLPGQKQVKVMVIEAVSFDEAPLISDHLKNRKQVVINFENTDRETAQRLVDFLSGVTYALNGSMQKVGNCIFMFTPNNVLISGEPTKNKGNVVNINWENSSKGEQL